MRSGAETGVARELAEYSFRRLNFLSGYNSAGDAGGQAVRRPKAVPSRTEDHLSEQQAQDVRGRPRPR